MGGSGEAAKNTTFFNVHNSNLTLNSFDLGQNNIFC